MASASKLIPPTRGLLFSWIGFLLFSGSAFGGTDTSALLTADLALRQARQFERTGQWDKALESYARLLKKDRKQPEILDRWRACLRRGEQARRHLDLSYRQQIQSLTFQESLQLYGEILATVHNHYVDTEKAEWAVLFRTGVEELRHALTEEVFCQEFILGHNPDRAATYQPEVERWGTTRPLRRIQDAVAEARDLALAMQQRLGLKPAAAVLELACGACNALDEYSYYLTPSQLKEDDVALRGLAVTTGVELGFEGDYLIVAQVQEGSSAHREGLRPGDRVLQIGERSVQGLTLPAALELLKGQAETSISIDVLAAEESQSKNVTLRRQLLSMPSVSQSRLLDPFSGIGYLRISSFQESTLAELNLSIAKLQDGGMKVLVLDLRGSPGGLVDSAIQVADRFLRGGLIVSSHGPMPENNQGHYARGKETLGLPLVVLVDNETASSAELLAGAIKDHQRGTLVGQRTLGKGTMQSVFPMASGSAGLRLTVARFFSPRGVSYQGNGITPHLISDNSEAKWSPDRDEQVKAALSVARSLSMTR